MLEAINVGSLDMKLTIEHMNMHPRGKKIIENQFKDNKYIIRRNSLESSEFLNLKK